MSQHNKAAVIVGKFQVAELSNEIMNKIERVVKEHHTTIIALQDAAVPASKNNPLDFETRRQMLLQHFPAISIIRIRDQRNNENWSQELDKAIGEALHENEPVIYGHKKAIKCYEGIFHTEELNDISLIEVEKIETPGTGIISAQAFRAGAIHTIQQQYSKVFPTVDVAVFRDEKLLLARKPKEDKFRFIGGFSDPEDESYEEAAKREVKEEADIGIDNIRYIGSAKVDDWRYRDEPDKVITHLFKASYASGSITAQDDIAELRWFDMNELSDDNFVHEHIVLFNLLKQSMNER